MARTKQVPPPDLDFYKTGNDDLNDDSDDLAKVNDQVDEATISTIFINFKNISFSPPRRAPVLVGEIDDGISFSIASTLHEAMCLPEVTDVGIFEKNGMNKDVYINEVVNFGNGTKNQVTFLPKGAETLTIETLLNIPYAQNSILVLLKLKSKKLKELTVVMIYDW